MSAFPKTFIRDKVEDFRDLKHLVEHSRIMYGEKPYFSYREDEEVYKEAYKRIKKYNL